jgi:molybdopterin-guanine dinucleotide biosynthesis protein MobB
VKLFGVTGWKNNGKTTLVERLVTEITGRGLIVSTIKHAHHAFDVDHKGRDSYRHRAAGAQEVLVGSGARWALIHELRGAPEPTMDELLARLSPCDLVLIEGYKRGPHPKVEAYRAEAGKDLIASDDDTIRLIATDTPLDLQRPQLDLDDITGIADFILRDVGLA